jgi:sigma-B regulation protein RsbU (phosphoserine phosphatase)
MTNKRLGIAAGVLVALEFALSWLMPTSGLTDLVAIALVIVIMILGFRLTLNTIRAAIWRLRNRLLVTYLFIGVIPIVLILALAAVGTWIVSGQVAVYLVTSELERRAASLQSHARFLSRAKVAAERNAAAMQLAPLIEERLPGLEMLLTGDNAFHYPDASKITAPSGALKSYTGYVLRDGRYYCVSVEKTGSNQAVLMAPIDSALLEQLVPGIGILNIRGGGKDINGRYFAGRLPPAANFLDFETFWGSRVFFTRWDDPEKPRAEGFMIIQTRPSAVLKAVFDNTSDNGQTALVAFAIIASLLLIVEAFSLVIGVSLSRTITEAVHGLYQGTTKIAKGDFSHRIPVKGKDQLASLGQSFNEMTAQLESLVEVAKEKERMQSELQIASEVQNQLFPRSAPVMKTIQLVGVCQPARMVSGDYYDYLCLPNGNLAIAIGDVAGKGISAALLMASIQSIMRSHLAAGPQSISDVVAQLNKQLYANTSAEKYATFFFGIYDEQERLLTYTNAGHLPPLVVRASGVELLEVTGTVVGAFPSIRYQEKSIRIEPGDVFVSYTDGITEPENAYGEEFGADRLANVAMSHRNSPTAEIAAKIMEAVMQWSTADEMPDDMTVVIAKGI